MSEHTDKLFNRGLIIGTPFLGGRAFMGNFFV